jgi:hypothetical protein
MADHGKEMQRRATGKSSGTDRTVRLKALYMQADSGIRAGAQYNLVAFAKSESDSGRPAFKELMGNEVAPRL